jgi:hypothetical protein
MLMRRIPCLLGALILLAIPLASQEAPLKAPSNAWLVLRAFLDAYPNEISAIDYDFAAKDWYMTVRGSRLYWANGRLLRKEDAKEWESWRPYVDYLYPEEVPDPRNFSEEMIAHLNADVLQEKRSKAPTYNIAFYDLVYDGGTRRRIESHIVRFDYLGKRVSVHESLVPRLKRIEARIRDLAREDEEVDAFVKTLASIEGYNWREIADSPSRSNHSWGIAIDFLPKNWKQKNIYWNWVSYWNENRWMLIPLDRRWMPPLAVVRAFESEGFVWGGKWLLWDNMHFEYRPELLALRSWGHSGDIR